MYNENSKLIFVSFEDNVLLKSKMRNKFILINFNI